MSAEKSYMTAGFEFVDTNVLLYAYDRGRPAKHAQAVALLKRLWQEGSGALSVQVLQEFYVNVTRKLPEPLEPKEAEAVVADFVGWKVYAPRFTDVIKAIRLSQTHRLSFWDAMIIHSARSLGCRALWSEDLNPGQRFGALEVSNPFAL
jgi:predicted nucleic acid-binding protein